MFLAVVWLVAKTYTQKPDKFQTHPINENQIFGLYRSGRIAYAPKRTGRINHLPTIMGIRVAYAIRPYMDNLILIGNQIQ